jgi:transcriptional regulator with XRE-family HTH domain
MMVLDKYKSMVYVSDMVGNRLREILTRERVTAYQLWKDLGINQGQLSKFFNGTCNISLDKLEQIADYLGYDITFVKRKHPRKGGK